MEIGDVLHGAECGGKEMSRYAESCSRAVKIVVLSYKLLSKSSTRGPKRKGDHVIILSSSSVRSSTWKDSLVKDQENK